MPCNTARHLSNPTGLHQSPSLNHIARRLLAWAKPEDAAARSWCRRLVGGVPHCVWFCSRLDFSPASSRLAVVPPVASPSSRTQRGPPLPLLALCRAGCLRLDDNFIVLDSSCCRPLIPRCRDPWCSSGLRCLAMLISRQLHHLPGIQARQQSCSFLRSRSLLHGRRRTMMTQLQEGTLSSC